MGIGGAGCCFKFFLGCVRLAKTEILSDRTVDEIRVLHNDGDMTPHDLQGQGAEVVSPEQDAPLLGIEETQEKPDQGRFAGTARPYDTETLTGREYLLLIGRLYSFQSGEEFARIEAVDAGVYFAHFLLFGSGVLLFDDALKLFAYVAH